MSAVRRFAFVLAVCLITAIATSFAQAEKVFVTKTGAKYHRESCRSLSKSKIEMPLAEAVARYEPCKVCKPPVPAATAATGAAAVVPPASAAPKSVPVSSSRCQATTKKGTQCSRNAKAGSSYCWQHGG